jgi:hypothetical protein
MRRSPTISRSTARRSSEDPGTVPDWEGLRVAGRLCDVLALRPERAETSVLPSLEEPHRAVVAGGKELELS